MMCSEIFPGGVVTLLYGHNITENVKIELAVMYGFLPERAMGLIEYLGMGVWSNMIWIYRQTHCASRMTRSK